MTNRIAFEIAGVCIAIESEEGLEDWDVAAAYRPFICDRRADILLHMLPGDPAIAEAALVFDSSPIWILHREGDMKVFKIFDRLNDQKRILVIEPNIRTARLYFPYADTDFVNPFYGPAIELLLIEHLSQHRGLIVHACGIDDGDRGLLFVGESGAGKSTLSKLWYSNTGGAVFSDDRIILRKTEGAYWMHGNPWHGEARFVSPRSAKLANIFFLQHDQECAVRPINRADTVVELLKASSPPFWDSQGIESAMAFLSDLTEAVPCQALSFKPDVIAVDFIKRLASR